MRGTSLLYSYIYFYAFSPIRIWVPLYKRVALKADNIVQKKLIKRAFDSTTYFLRNLAQEPNLNGRILYDSNQFFSFGIPLRSREFRSFLQIDEACMHFWVVLYLLFHEQFYSEAGINARSTFLEPVLAHINNCFFSFLIIKFWGITIFLQYWWGTFPHTTKTIHIV